MSLLELAARCEAAEGPDRELDEAIALALGWTPIPNPTSAGGLVGRWYCPDGSMSGMEGPPQWTRSLDAAMTLVPEGWCWCAADYKGEANPTTWQGRYQNAKGWASLTAPDDAMTNIRANAETPALALCAASLRARAAQGIEARSDETAKQAQPEGQEPGPKDAPNPSTHHPRESLT